MSEPGTEADRAARTHAFEDLFEDRPLSPAQARELQAMIGSLDDMAREGTSVGDLKIANAALASSMVFVTLKSALSSGETHPAPMASSVRKRSQVCQYVPPGVSTITTGAGSALPVCRSVRSSKASSCVPRPPGRMA